MKEIICDYVLKLHDIVNTEKVTESARQIMKDMLERLDNEKFSGISDNPEGSYRNIRNDE